MTQPEFIFMADLLTVEEKLMMLMAEQSRKDADAAFIEICKQYTHEKNQTRRG